MCDNEQRNKIEADYNDAVAKAKNLPDKTIEHAAEATRNSRLRDLYRGTYAQWQDAKQVRGVGLFPASPRDIGTGAAK